jgi:phosphatidylserine decarboxylase
MIRIHREGKGIILASLILLGSAGLLAFFLLPFYIFPGIVLLLIIILGLIVRFFRVPIRAFKKQEGSVLAPADGTVVNVSKSTESEYFKDTRQLVSIFMSIHNIHINWYPIQGKIRYYKYHPGKYLLARHPKSSELNERTSVVIENDTTTLLVRQIAGYVARRIVCYAREGKPVRQAEEMGFIKFGSRLDIYLPLDARIDVKPGDKTIGGLTIIAH